MQTVEFPPAREQEKKIRFQAGPHWLSFRHLDIEYIFIFYGFDCDLRISCMFVNFLQFIKNKPVNKLIAHINV